MKNINKRSFVLVLSFLVGCFGGDEGYNPNVSEICYDGVDNDGDGKIDNGIDCDGDGYCAIVEQDSPQCDHDEPDCNDSPGGTGINPGQPEMCGNHVDDNCNGQVDEGCPMTCTDPREGSSCVVGVGICTRTGTFQCMSGLSGAVCSATAGTPGSEICNNGLDDDCDGQVDEGCPATCNDSRIGSQCSVGIGVCARTGTWSCNNGTVSCNATAGTPGSEICNNGQDDDCDGQVDEGCPVTCNDSRIGQTCSAGVGVCQRSGTWVCINGSVSCNATAGNPGSETCGNGLDDDCDGQTDEGCPATCNDSRIGQTCSAGVGLCQRSGTWVCTNGMTTCNATTGSPSTETCGNGQDEDCDGQADEGCQTWFYDSDRDNLGCTVSKPGCLTTVATTQPAGYVSSTGDCDDNNASVLYTCPQICQPTTNHESGGLCTNGQDDDCDGLIDQNDPGCQNACLPITGGTVRFDLSASVQNACPNRAIIMYGSYAEGGRAHFSAYNATYFSEYISSGWFNGDASNYMRMQIVCGLSQAQYNQMIADPGNWWTYQGSATLYVNGLSLSSDLSASGITMSFNGKPMANDTVVSAPGGRVGQAWLPQCGG